MNFSTGKSIYEKDFLSSYLLNIRPDQDSLLSDLPLSPHHQLCIYHLHCSSFICSNSNHEVPVADYRRRRGPRRPASSGLACPSCTVAVQRRQYSSRQQAPKEQCGQRSGSWRHRAGLPPVCPTGRNRDGGRDQRGDRDNDDDRDECA